MVLLLAAYAIAAALPVLAAFLTDSMRIAVPGMYSVGQALGLVSVPILAMQPVLSARLKLLDRVFGLDRVYRFHKVMASLAGCLILVHPILLAAGSGNWLLLLSVKQQWYILLGKAALLLTALLIVSSLFYKALRLGFEKWRWSHNILVLLVLPGVIVHSLAGGLHLRNPGLFALWILLSAGALAAYLHHKVVGPARRKKKAFRVGKIHRESHDTWNVSLEPPKSGEAPSAVAHLPGQFQFLTFYRGRGLPQEEHPFTISSSPRLKGSHGSTIKESGDFTATIGETRPGDRIAVQAPFGRFSYVLHPEEQDFVFIAGGIGITPLMSMLRCMRDGEQTFPVLLLYGNKTEKDIVFQEEVERMVQSGAPKLKVVHVLEEAGDGWKGETGLITPQLIFRHTGGRPEERAYYVCGPPMMLKKILPGVRGLGVHRRRIHTELFSL
jgi:predicted ferric reductase